MHIPEKGKTLSDLYVQDCKVGSFANYSKSFFELNPHISRPFKGQQNIRIPDHTPMISPIRNFGKAIFKTSSSGLKRT